MTRLISIDYGKVKTGIAVTDPMQIIASGLDTVPTTKLFSFLKNYFEKETVETIVVGAPKFLDNTIAELEKDIAKFIQKIKEKYPKLNIERVDERFTSKMARDTMIAGGMKKQKRRGKKMVDKISATLILQSYMRTKQN